MIRGVLQSGAPRAWLRVIVILLAGCGPWSHAGADGAAAVPVQIQAPVPAPDPRIELESRGRFVFDRTCAVCHGRWGDGRGELSVGMLPRPNNLTRARFKFRSTPSGTLPIDEDLRRVITLGIAGSSMPAFTQLSDREVVSVIAYLKTFSRRWDDPRLVGRPVVLPAPPAWMEEADQRRQHARRGRELFQAGCAACHGPDGHGDGPSAAGLEDDAGRPAPPANLATGLWKSGRLPSDLFRTLTTGMDGTPMPSFGDAFSEGDRWDLVSFLLTLPGERGP